MPFEKLRSAFTKKQPSPQGGKAATRIESSNSNVLSATPQVPDHRGQYGLILLNPDYAQSSAGESRAIYDLDIVAIHGITGDAFKSWTHANQKLWLRDFLPDAFPGARVYTFGYPAEIFWSRSDGDIDSFARSLLEGLRREKRSPEHQSRRIIFVCHSMGGIVVKKALTIARIDDDDYGEIRNSVSAILFVGTPHRGAGFASLLKLPMQITSNTSFPIISITGNTRRDLLKNLEKDARILQEISKNFRNSMKDIKIASFIEKSIIPPLKKVIVDESTGIMDIPGERIVPMHGFNNSSMCRFDAISNSGYISILEVLQDWAEETKENLKDLSSADKLCLKSFAFPEMGYRRSDADKAHPNTCGWILQHKSYNSWLVKERGLLWIKGKPGAGKSTLLAFVYRTFQGVVPDKAVLTLEFFFHGRGTALQKSSIGMFRSLLHQLYIQDRATRSFIRAASREKEVFGEAGKGWEWQLSELQGMFFKSIIAAAKSRKTVVFIDALDESGSDAKSLVEYFHELNDELNEVKSKAAICISCRHYPVTAVIPGLDVLVEENNQDDIAYYVQAKLQLHTTREKNDGLQSEAWTEIERQIVSNASGVFQWARLVVPMVLDHYEEGYAWNEIHEMLAKVPRELGAVYEHILTHVIKPERRQKTLHLMQWVFLAERPLTLEELASGLAFDDVHISTSVHSYEDAEPYMELYGGICKLVNSLSGGLAEVKYHEDKSVVQFIHQSVSDFLLSTGLQLLVSDTVRPSHAERSQDGKSSSVTEILGRGHDRLSRSCVNYLRLALPKVSWRKVAPGLGANQFLLRFMDYASRFWIVHAARAEQYDISQQHVPLQFERNKGLLENWINIYKLANTYPEISVDVSGMTLLHLASYFNLRSIVRELLKDGTSVEVRNGKGETPLHDAARQGHIAIVEMFLDANAEPEPKNNWGMTPLECAAGHGHQEIVKLLLRSGSDIDNALQAAAEGGSIIVLKFLLDSGADINTAGINRCTPLQQAARKGHEDIVQYLLVNGANVNLGTHDYASALQAAAEGGHESIFQCLLDHGANSNLQGGRLGNALQAAAINGNLSIMKKLLARGAEVNAKGGHYGSALQAAAECRASGVHDRVLLLLNNGANVNACGGYYGNALQTACRGGHLATVALLIERGAEVNADCGHFGNALQAAAHRGHVDIIEVLLEHGANINAQGGFYGTALQAAACKLKTKTVEFLLEKGADIHIRGGHYETSLQAAASAGWGFMGHCPVTVLLDHGADIDINVQGGCWGNAVKAAVHEGDVITVCLLLRLGAILDPQDEEFSRSLLREGISEREIEDLLYERGYPIRPDPGYLIG